MVGKKFTCILCCLFVLALACGTMFAQSPAPAVAHTTRSKTVMPTQAFPTLQTIFSNFGPTSTNFYNPTTGYYVLGPNNSVGFGEQWVALPFIPAANSHVTVLVLAIGWISGTKKVNIGLYTDNGGQVGTLLASGSSSHIPTFGVCCGLTGVRIPSTAVTAGTQYWIGVTTDDTNAPDFTGVAESSNEANTSYNPANTSWISFSNNWPAGEALGSTP